MQPTLFRLEETPARYESVQQFLADSPWEPELLGRACAERVAPQIGVVAWVVDDTGIVKDGKHSPGVKRQYSGTLGKVGNCQITVSVHAVGERGTLPLGWRLYLPEEWCDDLRAAAQGEDPGRGRLQDEAAARRRSLRAAAGWELPAAPILADCAYGDDTAFRTGLHEAELEYVVAVRAGTSVYGPETHFAVPERNGPLGRPRTVARPDRKPESVRALAERLPANGVADAALPDNPRWRGRLEGRFAFVRVVATNPVRNQHLPPRWEWLIIEWPEDAEAALATTGSPTSPKTSRYERLARLARLRWTIELDYRQLKGELGLDHYEGRSYLGFHHHTALVTCAHAFLTEERLRPRAQRPA